MQRLLPSASTAAAAALIAAAAGCSGCAAAWYCSELRRRQQQAEQQGRLACRGCSCTAAAADSGSREDQYDPSPRAGYLEWDDYFMALAFLSAKRSKDPSKQVGAVIVGANRVVLGIGYNGFPRGCADKALPWSKKTSSLDPLDTKYPYVVHAEANALLNKNAASVEGATVYVTMFPCNECAKLLIQAGCKEVVYNEGKLPPEDAQQASSSASTSAEGRRNGRRTDSAHAVGGGATCNGSSSSKSAMEASYRASQKLLRLAGVRTRRHCLAGTVVLSGAAHCRP